MAEEKELIVRKTTSALIEKFFVYSGFDLPHDTYKEILYNNKKCMSNTENKIKRYYDGYMFLLHNSSNILSSKILLIFFYIIYQRKLDINIINKIINKHVFNEGLPSLEKAINLLLIISDELSFTDKIDKLLIPLIVTLSTSTYLAYYGLPNENVTRDNEKELQSSYSKESFKIYG